MGERFGTNVQPNNYLEASSLKDQSSVLERRHFDRQTDQSSFGMKRYLNDANPSDTFVLGQDMSAMPHNRESAMKAYIKAWDVQFKMATTKNEATEREV